MAGCYTNKTPKVRASLPLTDEKWHGSVLSCADTRSILCKPAHSFTLVQDTRDGMLQARCINKYTCNRC
ncbi:hypothetical protein EM595_p0176 (plasmid) [Duffyella gerundensis]|uniref:Uncharacterized protein n=1 Tax=Duffyella gerundensis TaxID=1619313 RepID=A0A0U5GSM6_9GAMM|nr:hypothetical protein EM595_p0176 [Duffyella gerundensis]